MSENLLRTLLPGAYASVRPGSEAVPQGRFAAYLERAESALAGARGLARPGSSPRFARPGPGRELERAALELVKGVRVAHGLSATRDRQLRTLLHGDTTRGVAPLTGPWVAKLEPLCALSGGAIEREDAARWITMLQELIARGKTIGPAAPPKRPAPSVRPAKPSR